MSTGKNIKRTAWYKGLDDVDKNYLERLSSDPRAMGDRDTILRNTGSVISKIFNKQLQVVADIDNIFKVLPQLAFPRKILVSSILSPGDITKNGIVVDNTLKLSDYSLSSQMTGMVRDLLENDLEVPTKLSKWMDEALILKGCHPILTLPSSVIDTIMGISMESSSKEKIVVSEEDYLRPLGLLGVRTRDGNVTSFESASSFGNTSNVVPYEIGWNVGKKGDKETVIKLPFVLTDNPAILAKGIINEYNLSQKATNLYGDLSLESMVRYPDPGGKKPKFMPSDVRREMFKATTTEYDRILVLPTPKEIEENVNTGHPIEYHLPPDSTIPVTSPGDPTDHKYYIVLIDENGYPLSGMDRMQHILDVKRSIKRSTDGSEVTSNLLSAASANLGVTDGNYDISVIDEMARINSALIETEVVRAIMAGANSGEGKLAISDSVSKLMLSRTLKGKRTVMLYIPADYITYIAFNHNELGVGKSILEDSKTMAGMLSTLTVANIIGSVEQAIPGKNLTINLDPGDEDPLGTATFLAREAMDLNFRRFPMGLNSTIGVAEEIQMNSYSVNVTGHPAFPEVSTSMQAKESSRQPIDTELMDKLNEYMHLLFSVPPEVIGSSNQADFATSVVATNLMLLKTVIETQTVANKHLSRYGRNYVRFSGVMVSKFYGLIKENKKSIPEEYKGDATEFISDFIENIRVKLPSPETENISHQMELVNAYGSAIDEAMNAYLSEESLLLEGYAPEIIQSVLPTLKVSYKNHAMRNYLRERGILTELDIFRIGDEDAPTIVLSDELKDHSKHVIKSVREFVKAMAGVLKPNLTELKAAAKEDAKAKENAQEVNDAAQPETEDENTGYDGDDNVSDGGPDDTGSDVDSMDGEDGSEDGSDDEFAGEEDLLDDGGDSEEEPEDESSDDGGKTEDDESEELEEETESEDELPIDSVDEDKL